MRRGVRDDAHRRPLSARSRSGRPASSAPACSARAASGAIRDLPPGRRAALHEPDHRARRGRARALAGPGRRQPRGPCRRLRWRRSAGRPRTLTTMPRSAPRDAEADAIKKAIASWRLQYTRTENPGGAVRGGLKEVPSLRGALGSDAARPTTAAPATRSAACASTRGPPATPTSRTSSQNATSAGAAQGPGARRTPDASALRGSDLQAGDHDLVRGFPRGRAPDDPGREALAVRDLRGTGARPGPRRHLPGVPRAGVKSQSQGFFSLSQPCDRCGGAGTVVEEPCATCAGRGRTMRTKRYVVSVPAGIKDGASIRLRGKGEAGLPGGQPGDLYVRRRRDALAGLHAARRRPRARRAGALRRGRRRRHDRGATPTARRSS